MITTRRTPLRTSTLAVLALALVACGGSDADTAEPVSDPATESAPVDDDPAAAGDSDADTAEPGTRPTQDDLCSIVGEVREVLAVTIGLTAVEDELGVVLGGDCAVESESVGYISLSVFPGFVSDAQEAAASIDGELTTPEELGLTRLTDAFLVTGNGGITQHAVFEEGGHIYLVQVESDTATTPIGAAVESAATLRAVIATR